MSQPSFFDLDVRHKKLNEKDPLVALNQLIDWENFRDTLNRVRDRPRKSHAGRKPYDVVLMFKILVLQHLYNQSDDEIEYQIRDRYSFCRFLGLYPEETVPDAKTIWLFREALSRRDLTVTLFNDFDYQLNEHGYKAKKGQIIDASFVEVPKQRNTRDENKQIKRGEKPQRFKDNPSIEAQKDMDARWTKKNNETHFGYKNHISIDNENKLIRGYEVTSAEVHDSQVFIEILADNSSKDVWADSAYQSEDHEIMLDVMKYRSRVHKKGKRNQPLSERSKHANTKKSKVRARVEHVFGSITNEQGGLHFRVIGLARTKVKVGMMNIVYNMRRLVSLHRLNLSFS